MNIFAVFIISLIVFVAPQASAQELPALVARIYPGATAGNTKEEKIIPCSYDAGAHHKAFCFFTKDSIDKVREFFAPSITSTSTLGGSRFVTCSTNFATQPTSLSIANGHKGMSSRV